MELDEALARRRSIRKYKRTPIPEDAVLRVLNAAHAGPSGANASPWRYVVVASAEMKRAIRQASEKVDSTWDAGMPQWFQSWLASQGITSDKGFLEDAPYLLVVFSDQTLPYSVESTWVSIGYALLAATQEGLGTLTYTPGDPGFLRTLLNLPERFVPQAILPLGIADEAPDLSRRLKKKLDRLETVD
jgi:nitroreductase